MTDAENTKPKAPFHIEGQTLVVDDEKALKRLRARTNWSPSSSKSVKSCPTRWVVEKILPRVPDPFGAAEMGTSAHAVFEVLFGLPAEQRTREKAVELVEQLPGLNMKDVVVPDDPADLMRWKAAVVNLVMGLFRLPGIDVQKVQVMGRERHLDTTHVGGVPFNGRIDMTDLLLGEDGSPSGTRVIDFKSAVKGMKSDYQRKQYGDDHGDQGLLYHIALTNLDGRSPDVIEIWYTATGQVYRVEVTDRDLERVEAEFVATFNEAMASAKSGVYQMHAGALCGYCPLATICPAAQEKGKDKPAKAGPAQLADRMMVEVILDEPEPAPVTVLPDQPDTPPITSGGTYRRSSNDMSGTIFAKETGGLRAWDETGTDTSQLSGLSYAAQAAFGLVSEATKILAAYDVAHGTGFSKKKANVQALAKTMMFVVQEVQQELGGSTSTMDGLNTRLRGALFTTIETLPLPLGKPKAEWDRWVQFAIRRVRGIAESSVDLWAQGPGDEPWSVLADAAAAASFVADPLAQAS